ncbi:MAG: response regulator [Clostridium sp.]|nr:response regulator [Clostridium sp.]
MSETSKKIRVVVVDDEPLEINLIKNCIDWKLLDMEIVGEAQNAISGMDLVEELSPDILFTDINMPIIDGIKFSEMVIQRRPKTKIVILSGYDDFDYAQKSIKIGVLDFLLKPINNDEVFKSASKLKNIIDYERESYNEYNSLKKQLSDNLPYIKEKFLIELLSRNFETEKIINKASFLGLRFKYQSAQVAAIEISSSSIDDDNVNNWTYFIRNIKTMNMIKDFFREMNLSIFFMIR